MAKELSRPKKFVIRLAGVAKPVNVWVTATGLEMGVLGKRKRITTTWEQCASHCHTSLDVPSHLYNRPMELLVAQAK